MSVEPDIGKDAEGMNQETAPTPWNFGRARSLPLGPNSADRVERDCRGRIYRIPTIVDRDELRHLRSYGRHLQYDHSMSSRSMTSKISATVDEGLWRSRPDQCATAAMKRTTATETEAEAATTV